MISLLIILKINAIVAARLVNFNVIAITFTLVIPTYEQTSALNWIAVTILI